MTAYVPIKLGQDALQWLRHLKRGSIEDWGDFRRLFIANFQSLSDKPAQRWDLKGIRCKDSEGLQSYLKRFQALRNRIPNISEDTVIDDFLQGSNDQVFVKHILERASTTSERLFQEADCYITADE